MAKQIVETLEVAHVSPGHRNLIGKAPLRDLTQIELGSWACF
jgi:hypothetical protein